jgi:hypothetical protein
MKKLIVLSGNSPRNQAWGEGCVSYFGTWFDEVHMQEYNHWQKGTKDIDIEAELAKLATTSSEDAEYYVFAKSIGSLLTLLSVHRENLNPKYCIFFGMPLELASNELFKSDWSVLENFTVPSLAFHNDRDPISYVYTKDALAQHNPEYIKLVTVAGDTHEYLDFEDYECDIKNFLKI